MDVSVRNTWNRTSHIRRCRAHEYACILCNRRADKELRLESVFETQEKAGIEQPLGRGSNRVA